MADDVNPNEIGEQIGLFLDDVKAMRTALSQLGADKETVSSMAKVSTMLSSLVKLKQQYDKASKDAAERLSPEERRDYIIAWVSGMQARHRHRFLANLFTRMVKNKAALPAWLKIDMDAMDADTTRLSGD